MQKKTLYGIEVLLTMDEIVRFHDLAESERRPTIDVIRDCALAGLDRPVPKKSED